MTPGADMPAPEVLDERVVTGVLGDDMKAAGGIGSNGAAHVVGKGKIEAVPAGGSEAHQLHRDSVLEELFDQRNLELRLSRTDQQRKGHRLASDDREVDLMHILEVNEDMVYRRWEICSNGRHKTLGGAVDHWMESGIEQMGGSGARRGAWLLQRIGPAHQLVHLRHHSMFVRRGVALHLSGISCSAVEYLLLYREILFNGEFLRRYPKASKLLGVDGKLENLSTRFNPIGHSVPSCSLLRDKVVFEHDRVALLLQPVKSVREFRSQRTPPKA